MTDASDSALVSVLRTLEPKVPLPEKLDGDRRKFRGFINQLELVFLLNASRYQSDATKVVVIGTLLTGKALAWFTPYSENMAKHEQLLNNYQAFRLLLQETFDEHDRALLAATRFRKLRQGSLSIPAFAAELRRIASDLTWNDATLVYQFRAGLNDEVKYMLLHHPYPETLDRAISLAVSVSNCLFQHRQEISQRAPDQRNSQRCFSQPSSPCSFGRACLRSYRSCAHENWFDASCSFKSR
jgi:hypothetical protein